MKRYIAVFLIGLLTSISFAQDYSCITCDRVLTKQGNFDELGIFMADGHYSQYGSIDFEVYVDSESANYSIAPVSDICNDNPDWEYISYETNSSTQGNYVAPNEWHRFLVKHYFVDPYEGCDDEWLETIFYYNPPTNTDCGSIADFLIELVPTISPITCEISIAATEYDTDCDDVAWSDVFRVTPPTPQNLTNLSGTGLAWDSSLEDNYSPTQFKVYRSVRGSSGPYALYATTTSKSVGVNSTGYYKVKTYVDGMYSDYSNYVYVNTLSKAVAEDDMHENSTTDHKTTLLTPSINTYTFTANIGFELAKDAEVNFEIFDLLGRSVASLPINFYSEGQHSIYWNGRTGIGHKAESGVYLVRMRTGNHQSFAKIIMTK